jgi:alcohol-forming fatty acyl-CoA reductase
VNLLGPTRIAQTLTTSASPPTWWRVHLLRGRQPPGRGARELVDESPFFVDVDWRAEVAAARRARPTPRPRAAAPSMLAEFRAEARAELGAAGTPLLAAKTEQLRSGG